MFQNQRHRHVSAPGPIPAVIQSDIGAIEDLEYKLATCGLDRSLPNVATIDHAMLEFLARYRQLVTVGKNPGITVHNATYLYATIDKWTYLQDTIDRYARPVTEIYTPLSYFLDQLGIRYKDLSNAFAMYSRSNVRQIIESAPKGPAALMTAYSPSIQQFLPIGFRLKLDEWVADTIDVATNGAVRLIYKTNWADPTTNILSVNPSITLCDAAPLTIDELTNQPAGIAGRGRFGDILQFHIGDDQRPVVAKTFTRPQTKLSESQFHWPHYFNEITNQMAISDGPYVLRAYGGAIIIGNQPNPIILMDSAGLGTFKTTYMALRFGGDVMDKESAIQVLRYFQRQAIEAVNFVLSRNIFHRDITGRNFLIMREGKQINLKLTDFEFSVTSDSVQSRSYVSNRAGSLGTMAPEIFDRKRPSIESELFSLGATLYTSESGRAPFASKTCELSTDTYPILADRFYNRIDSREVECHRDVRAQIMQTLAKEPDQRGSIDNLVKRWERISPLVFYPAPAITTFFALLPTITHHSKN